MKERIICAAIWFDDDKKHEHQPTNVDTGFVICGRRHPNCFATLAILMGKLSRLKYKERTQGFLTTENRFVDRTEAARIAFKSNQIINLNNSKWIDVNWSTIKLYSEDLY